MTAAYEEVAVVMQKHGSVGAEDVLFWTGNNGMTAAFSKLQHLLGWRLHEIWKKQLSIVKEKVEYILKVVWELV